MGSNKPVPVKLNAQEKDQLDISGYRLDLLKCIITVCVALTTFGVLFLIMLWRKNIKMRLFYRQSPLQEATKVQVKVPISQSTLMITISFSNMIEVDFEENWLLFKVWLTLWRFELFGNFQRTPSNKFTSRMSLLHLSAAISSTRKWNTNGMRPHYNLPKSGTVSHLRRPISIVSFQFGNWTQSAWLKHIHIRPFDEGMRCDEFHTNLEGLKASVIGENERIYGSNLIEISLPSTPGLIRDEVFIFFSPPRSGFMIDVVIVTDFQSTLFPPSVHTDSLAAETILWIFRQNSCPDGHCGWFQCLGNAKGALTFKRYARGKTNSLFQFGSISKSRAWKRESKFRDRLLSFVEELVNFNRYIFVKHHYKYQ